MTTTPETIIREFIDLCAIGDVDEDTEVFGWGDLIKRAKAYLAQPVDSEPVALPRRGLIVLKNVVHLLREQAQFTDEEGDDTNALEELLEALASRPPPVNQPAAWIWKYANGEEEVVFVDAATVVFDPHDHDVPSKITPLYAFQPPSASTAQPVALTDEQIEDLIDEFTVNAYDPIYEYLTYDVVKRIAHAANSRAILAAAQEAGK